MKSLINSQQKSSIKNGIECYSFLHNSIIQFFVKFSSKNDTFLQICKRNRGSTKLVVGRRWYLFFHQLFSFPTQFPRLRSAFGLASLGIKEEREMRTHEINGGFLKNFAKIISSLSQGLYTPPHPPHRTYRDLVFLQKWYVFQTQICLKNNFWTKSQILHNYKLFCFCQNGVKKYEKMCENDFKCAELDRKHFFSC